MYFAKRNREWKRDLPNPKRCTLKKRKILDDPVSSRCEKKIWGAKPWQLGKNIGKEAKQNLSS